MATFNIYTEVPSISDLNLQFHSDLMPLLTNHLQLYASDISHYIHSTWNVIWFHQDRLAYAVVAKDPLNLTDFTTKIYLFFLSCAPKTLSFLSGRWLGHCERRATCTSHHISFPRASLIVNLYVTKVEKFNPLPGNCSKYFLNDSVIYHIPQLSIFWVNFLNIFQNTLSLGKLSPTRQILILVQWNTIDTLLRILTLGNTEASDITA